MLSLKSALGQQFFCDGRHCDYRLGKLNAAISGGAVNSVSLCNVSDDKKASSENTSVSNKYMHVALNPLLMLFIVMALLNAYGVSSATSRIEIFFPTLDVIQLFTAYL